MGLEPELIPEVMESALYVTEPGHHYHIHHHGDCARPKERKNSSSKTSQPLPTLGTQSSSRRAQASQVSTDQHSAGIMSPSSTIKAHLCWAHVQTSKQTGARGCDLVGGCHKQTPGVQAGPVGKDSQPQQFKGAFPVVFPIQSNHRAVESSTGQIQVQSSTHNIQVATSAAQVLSTSHQ